MAAIELAGSTSVPITSNVTALKGSTWPLNCRNCTCGAKLLPEARAVM